MQGLLPAGGLGRLSYDVARFPWKGTVESLIGLLIGDSCEPSPVGDDHHRLLQQSRWHRSFYQVFPALRGLYLSFLRWIREEHGIPPMGLVYQAVPTFRVHPPGGQAVGEWHRDRDYGHADGEVNFWLPLTPARGTATLWIEQDGARKPVEAEYGQVVVFDGLNVLHGNVVNQEGYTRVSLDFRLALRDGFAPSGQVSVSAGKRLALGDYFEVI